MTNNALILALLLSACGSAGPVVGPMDSGTQPTTDDSGTMEDGSFVTPDASMGPTCVEVANARALLAFEQSTHTTYSTPSSEISNLCVTDSDISFDATYTYSYRYMGGEDVVRHPLITVEVADFALDQDCSVHMRSSRPPLVPVNADLLPAAPACAHFTTAHAWFTDEDNPRPIWMNDLQLSTTPTGHGSYIVSMVFSFTPYTFTFELEVAVP